MQTLFLTPHQGNCMMSMGQRACKGIRGLPQGRAMRSQPGMSSSPSRKRTSTPERVILQGLVLLEMGQRLMLLIPGLAPCFTAISDQLETEPPSLVRHCFEIHLTLRGGMQEPLLRLVKFSL